VLHLLANSLFWIGFSPGLERPFRGWVETSRAHTIPAAAPLQGVNKPRHTLRNATWFRFMQSRPPRPLPVLPPLRIMRPIGFVPRAGGVFCRRRGHRVFNALEPGIVIYRRISLALRLTHKR